MIKRCIVHVLSDSVMDPPEVTRKHYEGTNLGDTIGPVSMQHPTEQWQLSFKDKKEL